MKTQKKFILMFFVLIGLSTISLCAQDGYKLVWQDNFDGKELNKENWYIEVNGNGGGNSEIQYYKEDNISIGREPVSGNSCLIIHAKKENYLGKNATSGRLSTQERMHFKYGKLEARIKPPKTADGLWPAFWMLGADHKKVSWPRCGEIDIMELGNFEGIKNGNQETYFNGACHWGYYQPEGWYPNYAKHTVNSYGIQDDFHLYTVIWDDHSIKMYLDLDKYPNVAPYFEIGIMDKTSDISTFHYFHKPFFVIFNLAVGGNFTQIWDINKITAFNNNNDTRMFVDYVRLYQKGIEGEELISNEQMSLNENDSIDESENIYAFPNPAFDTVSIRGINGKPAEVYIISTSGKYVLSTYDSSEINISSLSEGSYVVLIINQDKKIYTCPFIKKR